MLLYNGVWYTRILCPSASLLPVVRQQQSCAKCWYPGHHWRPRELRRRPQWSQPETWLCNIKMPEMQQNNIKEIRKERDQQIGSQVEPARDVVPESKISRTVATASLQVSRETSLYIIYLMLRQRKVKVGWKNIKKECAWAKASERQLSCRESCTHWAAGKAMPVRSRTSCARLPLA